MAEQDSSGAKTLTREQVTEIVARKIAEHDAARAQHEAEQAPTRTNLSPGIDRFAKSIKLPS